jgi:predicted nucleic acid-binding protein
MGVALDSDAVIGFLDRGDPLHDAAQARVVTFLRDRQRLVASVVTFAEVMTGAKAGRHPEQTVRGFFEDVVTELRPVAVAEAERAAELRAERRGLRLSDALILATAGLHPDVDLLLCGDRQAMKVPRLGCRVELLGG